MTNFKPARHKPPKVLVKALFPRNRLPLILGIVFVIALFVGSNIVLFYQLLRIPNTQHEATQSELIWLTAQAKYNLLRLIDSVWSYGVGGQNISQQDVRERFDVFWNSFSVLSIGFEEGQIQLAPEIWRGMVEKLDHIENELQDFSQADLMLAGHIRSELSSLLTPLDTAALKFLGESLDFTHMENARKRSFLWGFALFYVGVLICGSILTAVLIYEVRRARRFQQQAASANAAKSLFLAHMSHEFCTPLNAILGFSELIRSEQLGRLTNKTTKQYATFIHKSGTHLLALVNQILDFAKLEAGKLPILREKQSLNDLAEEMFLMTRPHGKEGEGLISSGFTSCPTNPIVLGDSRCLKQILVNLLSNAYKFTPERGQVNLSVIDSGSEAGFVVTDTGIGMTPDGIKLALTPFGQIENPMTRSHEGTGLGLSLVRSLVEDQRGALYIQSTPGAGTSITVLFPKCEEGTLG